MNSVSQYRHSITSRYNHPNMGIGVFFRWFGWSLLRSMSDTVFYQSVAYVKKIYVWLYVVVAFLLLSAGWTARFFWQDFPQLSQNTTALLASVSAQWPEEQSFVYSAETNRLEATPAATLSFSYPETGAYEQNKNTLLAFFSASETQPSATVAATIWANSEKVIFRAGGSRTPTQRTWEQVFADQPRTLTRQTWLSVESRVTSLLTTQLPWLAAAYFLMSFLGLTLFRLTFLLIYTWLVQFWLRASGKKISYGLTYRIGLFVLVVAELLWLINQTFFPGFGVSIWLIWLVFMAALFFVSGRQIPNQIA